MPSKLRRRQKAVVRKVNNQVRRSLMQVEQFVATVRAPKPVPRKTGDQLEG